MVPNGRSSPEGEDEGVAAPPISTRSTAYDANSADASCGWCGSRCFSCTRQESRANVSPGLEEAKHFPGGRTAEQGSKRYRGSAIRVERRTWLVAACLLLGVGLVCGKSALEGPDVYTLDATPFDWRIWSTMPNTGDPEQVIRPSNALG
jgi:hypothetical protein